MRTQHENPVYAPYRHLIPRPGLYPADHANIFWNTDDAGRVREVEVVFIPRGGVIPLTPEGLKLWEAYAAYISRWSEDLGNSCDGWMQPDGLTPAQVFGHMLRLRFQDQEELVAALVEFTRIEGCDWARDMLSAFQDEEEMPVD